MMVQFYTVANAPFHWLIESNLIVSYYCAVALSYSTLYDV